MYDMGPDSWFSYPTYRVMGLGSLVPLMSCVLGVGVLDSMYDKGAGSPVSGLGSYQSFCVASPTSPNISFNKEG